MTPIGMAGLSKLANLMLYAIIGLVATAPVLTAAY
jgi:hypothetical protein